MDKYSIILGKFSKIKVHKKHNITSLDGHFASKRSNIKLQ